MHNPIIATAKLERARRSLSFAQEAIAPVEGRVLDFETAADITNALYGAACELRELAALLKPEPPVLTLNLTPAYPFELTEGRASHA